MLKVLWSSEDSEVAILSSYIDPSDAPVAYHTDALAYWNSKRADRFAPRWDELSLIDFGVEVVPFISVTDLKSEPLTSQYRFWGTKLTEVLGGDYTGCAPTDVPPKSLGMNINGGCGRLIRDRNPSYEVKEFQTQKGLFGRALILRLPLSDDGETVSNGINIYYFETVNDDQPLAKFFEKVISKTQESPSAKNT